jgi:hypothetical protein
LFALGDIPIHDYEFFDLSPIVLDRVRCGFQNALACGLGVVFQQPARLGGLQRATIQQSFLFRCSVCGGGEGDCCLGMDQSLFLARGSCHSGTRSGTHGRSD